MTTAQTQRCNSPKLRKHSLKWKPKMDGKPIILRSLVADTPYAKGELVRFQRCVFVVQDTDSASTTIVLRLANLAEMTAGGLIE